MSAKTRAPKKQLPAKPKSEPELLEPAVADDVVEEVYNEIRGLQRDALVGTAVKMGEIVVKRFYKGKLDAWRDHGPKESSLRKLADRFERDEESGVSAAGLYRAVAFYELDKRLGVSGRKQLTVTHIRAVLGLPEETQKQLLDLAEEKGWTSTQMEAHATKARKKEGEKRGRPALPAFVKSANLLAKLADDEDTFADMDDLDEWKDEQVQGAYDGVVKMRDRLVEVEKTLAKRLKGGTR